MGSPYEAQRNTGTASSLFPYFAALHTSYLEFLFYKAFSEVYKTS
ncbi:hypothetical protein COXBURSA331_A1525 [Coxiella burnetii RSA 331]|nr:hypothetical protein COXBURSA331_A1525 [Coxiella burnetii RSA 331]